MLELPKYVKRQKKKNGREFFYYERFRNTDRAWPRIPLPTDPYSQEFWQRCEQITSLRAQRDDTGNWFWIYQTDSDREYLLPRHEEGAGAFWQSVDEAIEKEKKILSTAGKTFRALVAEYKEHTAFTTLGEKTKKDYGRHLDLIETSWADEPVDSLTTVEAQKALDQFQRTPAAGRVFRVVLQKLIMFGIPRGYCLFNPIRETEKIKYKSNPYTPWPDWAFELFFQYVRISLHIPIYSALYTGQRKIDVIPMVRPKIEAEAIELIARKTNAKVWVPIHTEYRQILNTIWEDTTLLHLREDGTPWSYDGYVTAWQRELGFSVSEADEPSPEQREKAKAMKRLREARVVFHGLRKNAVNMLLEAGCTEAEVSALVEMSEEMVRHYSRDIDKRRLARNAMRRLEEGWKETRQRLFGTAADRKIGRT